MTALLCWSETASGDVVVGLNEAASVALIAVVLADPFIGVAWAMLTLHAAVGLVAVAAPAVRSAAGGAPTSLDQSLVSVRRRLDAAPRTWCLGAVAAVAVLIGLMVVLPRLGMYGIDGGGYGPSEYGSSSGSGWAVVLVVVGVLALALAFTPTMPWYWRASLVGGGVLSFVAAWSDARDAFEESTRLEVYLVLLPVVLIGGSVWGWIENLRTGATSTRHGWAGPGHPPPPVSIAVVPPPTAGARSRMCLHGTSALDGARVLEAVECASRVRGNWFLVQGEHVDVVGRRNGGLQFHIGGHCEFSARVAVRDGRTVLRIGGLDRWTQSREYYFGFVPAGPAHVKGFFTYTLFLRTVAAELARRDPSSRMSVTGPGPAPGM